jgi:hypothetical protein
MNVVIKSEAESSTAFGGQGNLGPTSFALFTADGVMQWCIT